MKTIKKIALVVVALVAAVLIYATTKPDTLHVERSASIQAAPERLHPLINDFHRWSEWSPWEKLDPALARTFSGTPSGRGAVYEWSGNNDVGQGRMEITESVPNRITIQLDFIKPFEAHNTTEFRLDPRGEGTNVTWTMQGPNSYMGKVMSVFMDMDRMIGADFEAGLANLRSVVQ